MQKKFVYFFLELLFLFLNGGRKIVFLFAFFKMILYWNHPPSSPVLHFENVFNNVGLSCVTINLTRSVYKTLLLIFNFMICACWLTESRSHRNIQLYSHKNVVYGCVFHTTPSETLWWMVTMHSTHRNSCNVFDKNGWRRSRYWSTMTQL